ncbi:MAG: CopK family periplasmic copper-binding protein [Burkholderiaceae bacterium]|nr:CopK family periplasmic copper-binding protein [Burkholderiaceae bacterium]
MKRNLTTIVLAAALAGVAAPVFADDAAKQEAQEVIKLKDGSILYVFKNGKMAKENKLGRAVHLRGGEVLEAVDGRKVIAVGNEVAPLDALKKQGHGG